MPAPTGDPVGRLQCVVLDCVDPAALAAFYLALLGGEPDRPGTPWALGPDFATLHTPDGTVLCFQRVADHQPPRWPDPAHPQQAHLDVTVTDLPAAERLVREWGATLLDGVTGFWRTYADPVGHPFCLVPH